MKLTSGSQDVLDSVQATLEELEEMNVRLDHEVSNLDGKLDLAQLENEKLLADIAELNEYVQELEAALAEAHLMSTDDGPEVECDPTRSSST